MKTAKKFLLLGLALGALTACETMKGTMQDIKGFEFGSAQTNQQRDAAEIPLICPAVKIVDELSSLSDFSDMSDRAEYNLISRVNLSQVESACRYDGKNAVVDLKLAFEGQLGPRGKARESDRPTFSYPFFIAVTDDRGEIKAKEVFGASMTYSAGERHHTYYESLRQIIPVADEVEARNFTVLIGFQLSPQQLQFNRQNMVPVQHQSQMMDTNLQEEIRIAETGSSLPLSLSAPVQYTKDHKIRITSDNGVVVERNEEPAPVTALQAQKTQSEKMNAVIAAATAAPATPATPPPPKGIRGLAKEKTEVIQTSVNVPATPDTKETKSQAIAAKTAPAPAVKPAAKIQEIAAKADKKAEEKLAEVSPAAGEERTKNTAAKAPSQEALNTPKEKRDPISVIDLTAPLDQ